MGHYNPGNGKKVKRNIAMPPRTNYNLAFIGPLAQLEEQVTFNHLVGGSSPSWPTRKKTLEKVSFRGFFLTSGTVITKRLTKPLFVKTRKKPYLMPSNISGTIFQPIPALTAVKQIPLFWNLTMCAVERRKLLQTWRVRVTLSAPSKKK